MKTGVPTTFVNVALNKPVRQSDDEPADNTGQKAVDGIKSGYPTRWVSDNSNAEHWIEIDLQGTYAINAFKIWRDYNNAAQHTKQFRLQANVGGAWVDVVSEDNNNENKESCQYCFQQDSWKYEKNIARKKHENLCLESDFKHI
ncbi:MAG: discoidin domain-containing protein [Tannerella sp.]|nr:discoidin domain-containing protein [Tannerella sp.]